MPARTETMPNLKNAIRYCAAIAATEEPIHEDPPQTLLQNAIAIEVAKITDLLAEIDEEKALAILAAVEEITTALATGRYLLAVHALIRLPPALKDATTNQPRPPTP